MAKRKRTRRRTVAKKRGRSAGRGRPRKLATVSLTDLQAEIHRRRSELTDRRDALTRELEELDQAIASFGGSAPARRGRPRGSTSAAPVRNRRGAPAGRGRRNKVSLTQTLRNVLKGKTLSVTDATEQVKKTGYKSSSANFRAIVNHALLTNPDMFKKVARGEYTAK